MQIILAYLYDTFPQYYINTILFLQILHILYVGPPSPSLGWVNQDGGLFLNKRLILTIFPLLFLLSANVSTGRQF